MLRPGAAVPTNSCGKRISSTQLQKEDTSNFMPIIPALRVKGHQQSAAEYCSELSLFKLNKSSLWCSSSRGSGLPAARQSLKALYEYVIFQILVFWKYPYFSNLATSIIFKQGTKLLDERKIMIYFNWFIYFCSSNHIKSHLFVTYTIIHSTTCSEISLYRIE